MYIHVLFFYFVQNYLFYSENFKSETVYLCGTKEFIDLHTNIGMNHSVNQMQLHKIGTRVLDRNLIGGWP